MMEFLAGIGVIFLCLLLFCVVYFAVCKCEKLKDLDERTGILREQVKEQRTAICDLRRDWCELQRKVGK